MGDEDGAVVVDMHKGTSLVEEERRETDAEFCRDNGEAAFFPFVGGVKFGNLGVRSVGVWRLGKRRRE